VLDRLERAFAVDRSELLATDPGRWAVFVQPFDGRLRRKLVGCFDDFFDGAAAGYRSDLGRRFIVKEILEADRVVHVPWAVPTDHR